MSLAEVAPGRTVTVERLGGERSFRRRLMEFGLLPGTQVAVLRVAPLGDPIELSVRGCHLSIRRRDASLIAVLRAQPAPDEAPTEAAEQAAAERGHGSTSADPLPAAGAESPS